ncbi:MAG: hypothetical protein OXC68_09205 [Aestuariivita sp.]|nr:hypothetical protein [Aestuariivita sp.]
MIMNEISLPISPELPDTTFFGYSVDTAHSASDSIPVLESAIRNFSNQRVMKSSPIFLATLVDNSIDLETALLEIENILDVVGEHDAEEPDSSTIENAKTLFPKIYNIYPAKYTIYPTENRGIAIQSPMKQKGVVQIECGPEDVVYCIASIEDNERRAKFYQMKGLPDEFIRKALLDASQA